MRREEVILGTEWIFANGSFDHPYIRILRNGRPCWVRKAVLLLEELRGRALTKSERIRISFLDGNRFNCAPGNVYIRKASRKCGTKPAEETPL